MKSVIDLLGNTARFRSKITVKEFDYGINLGVCFVGRKKRHAFRIPARLLDRCSVKWKREIGTAAWIADRIACGRKA